METPTLEKGVLDTLQVQGATTNRLAALHAERQSGSIGERESQAVDMACVLGAVAIAEYAGPASEARGVEPENSPTRVGQGLPEPVPPVRYGYREDSSPEVIALLHQAQAGDKEAFADLYRLHVDRVTRYVSNRMWDEDRTAIPDVVQDAFCEAFAELAGAHHDVKGWLLAHAAKAYIRFVRSGRKQERVIKSAREAVRREYAYGYARHHPGDITAIGHVMLVHALARLAPSQREVLQHRYLEGQTQKATAILVGKTLSAVRSAEHRARVKLRTELSGR